MGWYYKAVEEMIAGTIAITTDTVKVMLVDETYTFDPETLVVDEGTGTDLQSAEISITGYVAGWNNSGRQTSSVAIQSSGGIVEMALNAGTAWNWTLSSGATVAATVLIKEGISNDTTSRPIAYFDHANIETNGGSIAIQPTLLADGGDMQITAGSGLYTIGLEKILDGTISLSATKAMLLTDNTFTVTDSSVASLNSFELGTITGYTGGYGGSGRLAAALAVGQESGGDTAVVWEINSGNELKWTLGAGSEEIDATAIIYETGGTDATSFPVLHFDHSNTSVEGIIKMDWRDLANNGNFLLQVAI